MRGIVRGIAIVEKNAINTKLAVESAVPATIAHTALELIYLKTALYKPNLIKMAILMGRTASKISQYWRFATGDVESIRIKSAVQKQRNTNTASTDNVISRLVFLEELRILIIRFEIKSYSFVTFTTGRRDSNITYPCQFFCKYKCVTDKNKT